MAEEQLWILPYPAINPFPFKGVYIEENVRWAAQQYRYTIYFFWDGETIINGDTEFYKDRDAMLAPFEPKTPCRQFETRPCVRLTRIPDERFPVDECPKGECVRFPNRDKRMSS
jgi:hypothetical protein